MGYQFVGFSPRGETDLVPNGFRLSQPEKPAFQVPKNLHKRKGGSMSQKRLQSVTIQGASWVEAKAHSRLS